MIIWGFLNFRPQRGGPLFVLMEVPHKIDAGIPDNVRVVDFCEDIEQVLDVYIFHRVSLKLGLFGSISTDIRAK